MATRSRPSYHYPQDRRPARGTAVFDEKAESDVTVQQGKRFGYYKNANGERIDSKTGLRYDQAQAQRRAPVNTDLDRYDAKKSLDFDNFFHPRLPVRQDSYAPPRDAVDAYRINQLKGGATASAAVAAAAEYAKTLPQAPAPSAPTALTKSKAGQPPAPPAPAPTQAVPAPRREPYRPPLGAKTISDESWGTSKRPSPKPDTTIAGGDPFTSGNAFNRPPQAKRTTVAVARAETEPVASPNSPRAKTGLHYFQNEGDHTADESTVSGAEGATGAAGKQGLPSVPAPFKSQFPKSTTQDNVVTEANPYGLTKGELAQAHARTISDPKIMAIHGKQADMEDESRQTDDRLDEMITKINVARAVPDTEWNAGLTDSSTTAGRFRKVARTVAGPYNALDNLGESINEARFGKVTKDKPSDHAPIPLIQRGSSSQKFKQSDLASNDEPESSDNPKEEDVEPRAMGGVVRGIVDANAMAPPALVQGLPFINGIQRFDAFGREVTERAKGGPVKKPQRYLVGEKGNEMYVPKSGKPELIGVNGPEERTFPTDGKVIPHHKLPAPLKVRKPGRQPVGLSAFAGDEPRADGGPVARTAYALPKMKPIPRAMGGPVVSYQPIDLQLGAKNKQHSDLRTMDSMDQARSGVMQLHQASLAASMANANARTMRDPHADAQRALALAPIRSSATGGGRLPRL